MSQVTTSVQKSIPFSQIHIPEDQIRTDLPKIKEMAASLEENGQLEPIIVTNGGDEAKPYTLVSGARRCAAMEHLGWKGDRPVLVVVRSYPKWDLLGPIVDNWVENAEREDVSALDLANCIHNLVKGTYRVPEGQEANPVDRKTISQRFGISQGQVGKLLKMHECIDDEIKAMARKLDAPLHLLIALSTIEGEGTPKGEETEEEANVANRTKKQHAMFGQWAERRKALEEQGRQRGERSDKGKSRSKGGRAAAAEEPTAAIKPSKRVQHASYADSNERSYSVEQYLAVLRAKQVSFKEEMENAKSASARDEAALEEAYFRGILDGQRFLAGEIKTIKGLTKADFKVLEPEEETEEEETEEE